MNPLKIDLTLKHVVMKPKPSDPKSKTLLDRVFKCVDGPGMNPTLESTEITGRFLTSKIPAAFINADDIDRLATDAEIKSAGG